MIKFTVRILRVSSFLVSYLAGAIAGLVALGILVLSHHWIEMGSAGTYFVFGMILLVIHAILYFLLILLDWYIDTAGGFMGLFRAFFYGSLVYVVAVMLYSIFTSHISISGVCWLLILAIPSGGSSFTCMQILKEYFSSLNS